MIIDLDGLALLEPVALGVLIGARLQLRAGGGDVALVCTSPGVSAVFVGSGLDATFTLHPSIAAAIAATTSAPAAPEER